MTRNQAHKQIQMIFKTKGGGIGYIKYYFIANTTAMGLRKAIAQRMDCLLHTNNRHTIMTKISSTSTNADNI